MEMGQFSAHFQPIMMLRTDELAGFEVLARWKHPELGMIVPDTFVPLAEREGWIGALTAETMRQAFAAAATVPGTYTLSFNVSPSQLGGPDLPGQIRKLSEEGGFSLDRIVIEITEAGLNENPAQSKDVLEGLKALGCRLALDDFGLGRTSLQHLHSLPFDELKVDRGFVSSMATLESRKIVAGVVGLGQSLGLTTTAKGVETQEQVEALLWLGCDMGQGWLFSGPEPAEKLGEMIGTD
jgi:EAL domain-containing protein (putative c-di-GMP-specific phosphodiesterase class I)